MAGSIGYGTLEVLNIGLGSGGDTILIKSTHAGVTTLSTNGGADTVNVQATTGATNVNTGAGNDTINVGSKAPTMTGGVMSGIQGKLTVDGGADEDAMLIDDSGNGSPSTLTLDEGTIEGLGMGPGGIVYSNLESLDIGLGSGGNTVNIRGLGAELTLRTGAGDDTVRVGTLAPAVVGGTLNRMKARLTLDGQGGNDTLYADDSGDLAANTGLLTKNQLTGLGMTAAPNRSSSGIGYGNFEGIDVALGSGNDTFVITSTVRNDVFRTQSNVSTGAGNDTVTVTLNATIDGALAVNLQAGDDRLNAGASTLGIVVFGGDGNDTITGGSGADVIFGDRGTVELFNAGALVTQLGLEPAERGIVVTGTGGTLGLTPKLTDGVFSEKRVAATRDATAGGNDLVLAGAGNDLVFGGAGRDRIEGQDGDDTIVGDNAVHTTPANTAGGIAATDVVTLSDAAANTANVYDDIVIAGQGNDRAWGGAGRDVMLGGLGSVLRSYAGGVNGAILKTDVLLLDAAYLSGSVPLDAAGMPKGDLATVNKLIEADIVLLAGAVKADDTRNLLASGDWDARALLLELLRDGNDTLHGGDGDDAVYGQMGNDVLAGDAGNDMLSGGTGNDTVAGGEGDDTAVGDDVIIDGDGLTVPNVTHGLLVGAAAGSQEVTLGIVLGAGGSVIVPAVEVVLGRDVNAGSTALAQVIGYNPMIPVNNALVTTSGLRLVPTVSLVPDYGNHLDQLAGNDIVSGGNGNDLLVGDDLVISAPTVTFDAAAAAKAETITRAAYALAASWSDLVHWQYKLLGDKWTDKEDKDDRIVIDKLFIIGEDTLDGGAGNDVLVGDNSIQTTPKITLTADASFAFSLFQDGMNRITDEIVGAQQDLVFLEHRLRAVPYVVLDSNGKNPKNRIEHHIDAIARSSDVINAGSGDDLVVGDAFVVRAPLVTITAGPTPPVKSKDDWSEPEKWSSKGFRSSWWKTMDWDGKDLRQLDRIIVNADQIDGSSGNDLIWGDSVALVSATVQPGAGVDIKAKYYTDGKKYADDGIEALTAVQAETERFLRYSKHGHDHKYYWRNVTWARPADASWFNSVAGTRGTDGGDQITGGDGDDVIYGQEGVDNINGGLGNDWLIGGSGGSNNKDILVGGGGIDKINQGDNNSSDLRAKVTAMMPSWSGAFAKVGLPIDVFSANTRNVQGHKQVDVDLLGFVVSPWSGAGGAGNSTPAIDANAKMIDLMMATGVPLATADEPVTTNWLDDFINHAGKTSAQRNPNRGLAVKV